MGNQNNMNYQNNNNVENQINNIITINNEINVNKDNHILPDVQTKACPSWISFLITGISVIADSLSIMDMILHNPIKLLFRFEDRNTHAPLFPDYNNFSKFNHIRYFI